MNSADHLSFASIYEKYHRKCYLFTKSYVHDGIAAEDIASESLIKLWEMSRKQIIENPQAALFVIVKNKALDWLRHQSVRQAAFSNISEKSKRELQLRINTLEANDPEKVFSGDIEKIIEETLALLPPKTREIFSMYRLKDVSKSDIARQFDISVKGVDYHISAAMARLKEALKDYFPLLFFIYFQ